jgi:hypothetical protein
MSGGVTIRPSLRRHESAAHTIRTLIRYRPLRLRSLSRSRVAALLNEKLHFVVTALSSPRGGVGVAESASNCTSVHLLPRHGKPPDIYPYQLLSTLMRVVFVMLECR